MVFVPTLFNMISVILHTTQAMLCYPHNPVPPTLWYHHNVFFSFICRYPLVRARSRCTAAASAELDFDQGVRHRRRL